MNELVLHKPQELVRQATDIAGVCKDIVLKCACSIQGKKYVKAEGWMAIATAHGCIASSRDVKKVEGGYTAVGEIRRIADGILLAQAEGFVGKDEKRWGNADEYACRAMAQTRAISRACRAAFAHVVVLMDAGLSTTPAEEVPDTGFEERATSLPKAPIRPVERVLEAEVVQTCPEPENAPSTPTATPTGGWREVEIGFGKNKGKKLGELEGRSVMWYAENFQVQDSYQDKATGEIKKVGEKKLAADRRFREALDLAAKELGGDSCVPF